ncbi:MAG: synthase subcomplex gamma subunit [Planctomycetaceae bacterium]|nr:synthase subcomplex gamma subunit [Planctomycetaceae bacterium]
MAKARAIVKRLKAVKNIRKITRTMELIATARFKKAMDRATEAATYTRKISELVADLSKSAMTFTHPLLQAHPEEKHSILLILTSNRGLCGGYNSGVLRMAQRRMKEAQSPAAVELGHVLQVEVSGKRGLNFMRFQQRPVSESYTHFEDRPAFEEIEKLADRFIELYVKGKLDRLDVAYVQFHSIARQNAVVETLLPVGQLAIATRGSAQKSETEKQENIEYEFVPSAKEILEEIVPASFKARLFKCFLDAAVSEQIARMVAMKGATENAGSMIGDLTRNYNRARQSQITSELSEIIGGAAALE